MRVGLDRYDRMCVGLDRVAILRPVKGRIKVVIPYTDFNRIWIKGVCGDDTRPAWNKSTRTWDIARAWVPQMLDAMLRRFGTVDMYSDHFDLEICNTSCQLAVGDECTCSCGGNNHGGDNRTGTRRNWVCIDEDTETLVGVSQMKRFHHVISPDMFMPIADRVRAGFEQYSYSKRYPPIYGECRSCGTVTYLIVDHCHIHGWIRDRICTRCNVTHPKVEKEIFQSQFYLAAGSQIERRLVIWQLAKCPDCRELIETRNVIYIDWSWVSEGRLAA